MSNSGKAWRLVWAGVGLLLLIGLPATAHDPDVAAGPRVDLDLADAVGELKFRDFYKLPIGPRGLEPDPRLLALAGKRVRLVGYMARQDASLVIPGLLILVALPVTLGDEDESFADDLPAAAVYVHLAATALPAPIAFAPGLMALTGTLQVGPQPEPDGRWSFVRLQLDTDLAHASVAPEPRSALMEKLDAPAR